jgi:hypothetical protein
VKLLLHIGTHKTGTTALQQCLLRNERVLLKKGIYYAHWDGGKNANELARAVSRRRKSRAENFLQSQLKNACASGAGTIVVSAESFYAMTMFDTVFKDEASQFRGSHYWRSESASIEFLRSLLPSDMRTKIVVFFRRQDQFLESLYHQMVKSAARVSTLEIAEFRALLSEALDYRRHMDLWSAVFPNCAVYSYDQTGTNIAHFFLRNVLGISTLEEFRELRQRSNIRFNRDILEFYRLLNQRDVSAVGKRLNKRACVELSHRMPGDAAHQEFLSPEVRIGLLTEVQCGNSLLRQKFNMPPFTTPTQESLKDWAPYPGLSVEKVRELTKHHRRIRRRLALDFVQQRLRIVFSRICAYLLYRS